MDVEVIPQPPARPGGPAFDPERGMLLATAEAIERLVALLEEPAWEPELEAAGAVVDRRPHPALRSALAAIAAPRRHLVLQGGTGSGGAWIGAEATALAIPADHGRLALDAVAAARYAEAIAAACGVGRGWEAPAGGPLRRTAAVLARDLATPARRVPGLPAPVTAHWRVVDPGSDPPTAVELLVAGEGAWLVVPSGSEVELRPASAAEVVDALNGEGAPEGAL